MDYAKEYKRIFGGEVCETCESVMHGVRKAVDEHYKSIRMENKYQLKRATDLINLNGVDYKKSEKWEGKEHISHLSQDNLEDFMVKDLISYNKDFEKFFEVNPLYVEPKKENKKATDGSKK